ncbi:hypothetical protein N7523_007285 [Penicillium sp. IBT 18751x]|nr:hypothetical protein N7523_007285 [Penicillium sp. IBT 18751x]
MTSEAKSLLVPLNGISSQCDLLKNVMKDIALIGSNPELQNIATIINEIDHQKRQNEAKEEDLAKLQIDLQVYREKTEAAIQVNLDHCEKLKGMQKNVETERDNLQYLLAEKIKDLEERTQEIESLRAKVAQLQSNCSQEQEKVAKSCAEITDLQNKMKERDIRIEKMHSTGSNLKTALSDQRKNNEDLKKQITLLQKEEQKSLSKLQKLESFTVGHTEVNEVEIRDEFNKLWDYATEQLHAILNQDLEDKALKVGAPLPPLTRCPTYLADDSNLRTILCSLAEKDHEKEAFCRSLLLSIDKKAQQENLQLRIQAIVRNVSYYLHGGLSETQDSEIRERLENIVQRAVKVWRPIQSSQKRYEPDFEPYKWEDDESHLFRFPSGDKHNQEEPVKIVRGNVLLTVFPRICLVQGHERDPLTYVTQLAKSQELCLAAEQEISREGSSPVAGRMSTNGRRNSVAQGTSRSNGGSFLERS